MFFCIFSIDRPPRDFIKPKPGGRQRAGILQPAHGIPFMSLEDQEREAREQDLKLLEEVRVC